MIQIIFGIFLFIFSVFSILEGIKEQCNIKNYVLKTDVKNVFKDVNWSIQTFSVNNGLIKDNRGNDKFYPIKEIDEAIKKLNEKL